MAKKGDPRDEGSGRQRSVAGLRPVVVATRLSVAEAEWMDAARGSLSRAEFLRLLMVRERRRRA